MNYTVTWNDGKIDRYSMRYYTLRELQNLVKEVTLATKGTYTAIIGTEEGDELC